MIIMIVAICSIHIKHGHLGKTLPFDISDTARFLFCPKIFNSFVMGLRLRVLLSIYYITIAPPAMFTNL